MKISICDDEFLFRKNLILTLEKNCKSIDTIISEFSSGEELIKVYKHRTNPFDIIFLDIEMGRLNGIETAKNIRAVDDNVIIIFLTGHLESAPDGYKVSAFRFLSKPIQEEKLLKTMQEAIMKLAQNSKLIIHKDGSEVLINPKDILYIEAQNKEVLIHTLKECFVEKRNLNELEKELKEVGFFRTHRSYLVNLSYVREYDNKQIILENREKIFISRAKAKGFKERLFLHIKATAR